MIPTPPADTLRTALLASYTDVFHVKRRGSTVQVAKRSRRRFAGTPTTHAATRPGQNPRLDRFRTPAPGATDQHVRIRQTSRGERPGGHPETLGHLGVRPEPLSHGACPSPCRPARTPRQPKRMPQPPNLDGSRRALPRRSRARHPSKSTTCSWSCELPWSGAPASLFSRTPSPSTLPPLVQLPPGLLHDLRDSPEGLKGFVPPSPPFEYHSLPSARRLSSAGPRKPEENAEASRRRILFVQSPSRRQTCRPTPHRFTSELHRCVSRETTEFYRPGGVGTTGGDNLVSLALPTLGAKQPGRVRKLVRRGSAFQCNQASSRSYQGGAPANQRRQRGHRTAGHHVVYTGVVLGSSASRGHPVGQS